MRAGELKTRIVFHKTTMVGDDYGGLVEELSLSLIRRGKLLTLTGKEYYVSEQLFSESSHKIIMRWDRVAAKVSNEETVKVGSRAFNVIKCFDPGGERKTLIVIAKEVT